jgi:pimeloyl-ACP methyl ester carboxylesterase
MNRIETVAILVLAAVFAGCESREVQSYEDGFAPVANGQLYYQVGGSGDAVVLIHGNAGDHRHWNNQFEYLTSQYRVIRYDVRGYGKSSVPVLGSSYSDAADLAELLDYLDIDDAHIVGWSMGSGVAFDFATAYPERTESLVSVGPWINGYSSKAVNDLFVQMGAVSDAVAQGGAVAGSNAFADLILGESIFEESADEFMRNVGSEYSWWAFTNPSQSIAPEPSAASQLSELAIPVLVITSEHDLPVCREVGDLIDSTAPNSRQVILQSTGHLMHIERPDAFNAELLTFLDDPR